MAGRIVLFGATGYTGDLTARAMVARGADARRWPAARGARARAGGRSSAAWSGRSPTSTRAGSVRALVERGDVS